MIGQILRARSRFDFPPSNIRSQLVPVFGFLDSQSPLAAVERLLAFHRGREGSRTTGPVWGAPQPTAALAATVIKESTGAFSRMDLAEGDHRAIARSDGRTQGHHRPRRRG
jgi:hypothetical protein